MANMSESLIQDILNLKAKGTEKTASARLSKSDILAETLLKMAEEMESEEEEKEEEKKEEDKEKSESESESESSEKSESESGENSQTEDIVAAALAELDNAKEAKARGEHNVANLDYQKLAKAILKEAVDGTAVFGLDADMTANPKAEPGTVATEAKALADKQTSTTNASDKDMGVKGPTDPMQGVAPQAMGGEDTPLTPGEIKSAMAKLSNEDAAMLFKLAQVGYDVTVDVLSDELVEKQAMAQVVEKAERVKAAQAYNYLISQGINPFAK